MKYILYCSIWLSFASTFVIILNYVYQTWQSQIHFNLWKQHDCMVGLVHAALETRTINNQSTKVNICLPSKN